MTERNPDLIQKGFMEKNILLQIFRSQKSSLSMTLKSPVFLHHKEVTEPEGSSSLAPACSLFSPSLFHIFFPPQCQICISSSNCGFFPATSLPKIPPLRTAPVLGFPSRRFWDETLQGPKPGAGGQRFPACPQPKSSFGKLVFLRWKSGPAGCVCVCLLWSKRKSWIRNKRSIRHPGSSALL